MGRLPTDVRRLGWASLLTDTATEAIYPLIPVFLARVLHAPALALGIIEGVAEATSSTLKILSGRWSDRARSRRGLVLSGYAISSLSRPFIALAQSWSHVLVVRFADRIGKGIRTSPRDAMLAQLATKANRGYVFGFHRAMDHIGAVLGPLLAFLFLTYYPGRYRVLFALTIVPGLLALWMLLRVKELVRAAAPVVPDEDSTPLDGRLRSSQLPSTYKRFLGILILFTLGNSTDAFLILRLTDLGASATNIPLLWALLHAIKAGASLVGGHLSDRIGRKQILLAGWLWYAGIYLSLAIISTLPMAIATFLLYGLYYGLTESAERAIVVDLSSPQARGAAFGFYHAVLGFSMLAASVLFGMIWTYAGSSMAFAVGAGLALVASLLLAALRFPDP